jgi:hypothetical protein
MGKKAAAERSFVVVAGLGPAIHPREKMDTRVKPAYDSDADGETLAPLTRPMFNAVGDRMTAIRILAVFFAAAASLTAAPARADTCDDLAKQLADQIPGLKIGETRGGVVALTHPAVTQASLGCSSKNRTNSMFAATDKKKPADSYYDFLAQASALVFTITKDDTLRGIQRCVGRTNILRGYELDTRYRKLDIHCTVEKTGVRISVSRAKDG